MPPRRDVSQTRRTRDVGGWWWPADRPERSSGNELHTTAIRAPSGSPEALGGPTLTSTWLHVVDRQCAMEALPAPETALPEALGCFDLILGLSQSRDGRYSRSNVDGSASIDGVPSIGLPGAVPTAMGTKTAGRRRASPDTAVSRHPTRSEGRWILSHSRGPAPARHARLGRQSARACTATWWGRGLPSPVPTLNPRSRWEKRPIGSDAHHPRAPHGSKPRPPTVRCPADHLREHAAGPPAELGVPGPATPDARPADARTLTLSPPPTRSSVMRDDHAPAAVAYPLPFLGALPRGAGGHPTHEENPCRCSPGDTCCAKRRCRPPP